MGTKRTRISQSIFLELTFVVLWGNWGHYGYIHFYRVTVELSLLLQLFFTAFGVLVVFSVPFVGLNRASVKSEGESHTHNHMSVYNNNNFKLYLFNTFQA